MTTQTAFKVGDIIESTSPPHNCLYRITHIDGGYGTLYVIQSRLQFVPIGYVYKEIQLDLSSWKLATDDPNGW